MLTTGLLDPMNMSAYLAYGQLLTDLCDSMLEERTSFMKHLESERFDLVILEDVSLCGSMIAKMLDLPFIYTSLSNTILDVQRYVLFQLSYIPVMATGMTIPMSFIERVHNTLLGIVDSLIYRYMFIWNVHALNLKHGVIADNNYYEIQDAELILWNKDFILDFPRPFSTNVVPYGALTVKPAMPLEQTVVFINHAGTNGIYEAIYHGVPMVNIPLGADHFDNAAKVQNKGMGKTVFYSDITEESLYQTIMEVVNNNTYKLNTMYFSKLYKDKPMNASETVAYWVNYVFKYGGKHLNSNAKDMSFIQYYLIDIILLLSVLSGIILLIIVQSCSMRSFLSSKKIIEALGRI
uniref:UDP-glucuronosyltransferase 2C1-like n=1 Tax=Saccoglossus kowalevskii TaxID=10224 RepID=A0ABM0LUR9_SACKO|nr:PREDICTED: UDP-glucuronosyltransferase 2C1-like [Saccoglossus kowalevskii]